MTNHYIKKFQGNPMKLNKYIVLLLIIFLTNCAGSRASLKFQKLKYPCSMSAFLYGPNNEVLMKGRDLIVIGHVSFKQTFWGTCWSIIPLTDDTEFDDKINFEIKKLNGDGVINLQIQATSGKINQCLPFNLLPIWFGNTTVEVFGEVVTRKKQEFIKKKRPL